MFKFSYWIILFATYSLCALTTLNVTLNSDNNPGGIGEVGDLRYRLNEMNQALNIIPDDYAIVFDSPMTIQLNGILPIINNSPNAVNITIGNPGSTPTVIIDGNNAYSGFFIPMGNVTIQNILFQNLIAQGGKGGDGISGGGGGMGAGPAIYAPQSFLNGSNPSITLMNVSINNCAAVGGNGGSYVGSSATGNEGGGGGGGRSGNGGSITTAGSTGGAGAGGFGGDGGNVTLSTNDLLGGGGGGGGGLGSRATIGLLTNLGNGGSDQNVGSDGNGYGLTITAGSGGGGYTGGNTAGGGGGGAPTGSSALAGGGGGGSLGSNGFQPQGSIAPGGSVIPSGGNGGDGGGGAGGGVVITSSSNAIDGQAGSGGYAAGGGGGAGTGASDIDYTVQGGSGGIGGGGGGGGINQSGTTPATGGNSLGGGGGAGGGPSNGFNAQGGIDIGNLGGGSGGFGDSSVGSGFGGGGGGGGSGLGGAIFIDSNLNFTLQALSGISTIFNTANTSVQAGIHGLGGPGGSNGLDGSALANSIFLRTGSSLTFMAQDINDVLTLGSQVAFTDDTIFGAGGTNVFVRGNGTVVYNGTTNYQGTILINNANFKVNGLIDAASVLVCRDSNFSSQRGTLSGSGTLTGNVFANSGAISPEQGGTLTVGNLSLNPADPGNNTLGSLVHIGINSGGTSLVAVTGPAILAGTLEIDLDPTTAPGTYTILTSSGITGTFDSVAFMGPTPDYSLSYLPSGNPTFVQLNFLGFPISVSLVANPTTIYSGMPSDLTATIIGGTAPFTLAWSDGVTTTASTNTALRSVSPAITTNYTVIVTDANGFMSAASNAATVTVIDEPSVILAADPSTLCLGDASTLTATISGGIAPFTLVWSDGITTTTSTNTAIRSVSPIANTNYTVTVTDVNGFTSPISNSVIVAVSPEPNVALTVDPSVIRLGNTSTLTATINTGIAPFTFIWSDGVMTTTSSNTSIRRVTPTNTTVYTVTSVADSNGCVGNSSNSVTVSVNSLPDNASTLARALFTKYCSIF